MKRMISLILVLCFLLTLAACQENPAPVEPVEPVEPTDVAIRVWLPEKYQAEGNNWLEEMENRFQAAHPEYRITWNNEAVNAGDEELADLSAELAPDVYLYSALTLGKKVPLNVLTKLEGAYLEQVQTDNAQVHINASSYGVGAIYGFPMENDAIFLYYDKTVFTAEDVTSLDKIAEKGRVILPFEIGSTTACILLGCGISIYGETGLAKQQGIKIGRTNSGYLGAKKMVELIENPNVTGGGTEPKALMEGKAEAVFGFADDYFVLKDAMGDRLGVAMLPKFTADGDEYQMKALTSCYCIGVNPKAEQDGKQELCMEFASFLASAEGQLLRYEMTGMVPMHQGLRQHEKIAADPVAVAQMDTATYAAVPHTYLLTGNIDYYLKMNLFGTRVSQGNVTLENYKEVLDSFF